MTHLVYGFCVDIAFSNSSSALDFFNFFTKLLTAFSDHLPSIDESSFPFFHANKRFTIGGVNGSIFETNNFTTFPFSSNFKHLILCLFVRWLLFFFGIPLSEQFFFDFRRRRRVSVCIFSLDMIWMMSGLLLFFSVVVQYGHFIDSQM